MAMNYLFRAASLGGAGTINYRAFVVGRTPWRVALARAGKRLLTCYACLHSTRLSLRPLYLLSHYLTSHHFSRHILIYTHHLRLAYKCFRHFACCYGYQLALGDIILQSDSRALLPFRPFSLISL